MTGDVRDVKEGKPTDPGVQMDRGRRPRSVADTPQGAGVLQAQPVLGGPEVTLPYILFSLAKQEHLHPLV